MPTHLTFTSLILCCQVACNQIPKTESPSGGLCRWLLQSDSKLNLHCDGHFLATKTFVDHMKIDLKQMTCHHLTLKFLDLKDHHAFGLSFMLLTSTTLIRRAKNTLAI